MTQKKQAPIKPTETTQTERLTQAPKLTTLLLKALFKRSKNPRAPQLPAKAVEITDITLDEPSIKAFHQVVQWPSNTPNIHPCFVHTLAFKLHLHLLLSKDSPFALLGLVHIGNQIRQYRPLTANEVVRVQCEFGEISAHRRGWLFSIKTFCYVGDELVWQSQSDNLSRTKHANNTVTTPEKGQAADTEGGKNKGCYPWNIPSDMGKQYARVSGDYNPIHLAAWSAKLFGFNRAIAHGMWSKSRCISQIKANWPEFWEQETEVSTRFKLPIFLPNQVEMQVNSTDAQSKDVKTLGFSLKSNGDAEQSQLHLEGKIQTF